METTLDFATQLAQDAGKLLLSYYQPGGIRAELKSDRTVVTQADFEADRLLQNRIRAAYPDDGVLSEEGGTTCPQDKEFVWVIDPLDGTTNFSLGLHYWGVSIARLRDGYPALGVLYFPLLDELITVSRGGGAYLNGSQLQVDPDPRSKPSTFFSYCSRTHRRYDVRIRYKPRILGAAAFGLCTIARGSAILALEVTPKVWDFSVSWLVTEEAGGVIAPIEGDSPYPLVPGFDYGGQSYPLLVAPSQEIWDEGRSKIRKR